MACNAFHRIVINLVVLQWALLFLPTGQAFSVSHSSQTSEQITKQLEGINGFISKVTDAVLEPNDPNGGFVSFTLKGPKAPRKTRKMSDVKRAQIDKQKEELRGRIREVQGRLFEKKRKLFLQTTIKYHSATDVAQNYEPQDVKKHLRDLFHLSSSGAPISEWGKIETSLPIYSGELETSGGRWKLDLMHASSKKKICKFIKNKETESQAINAIPRTHDQPKNLVLDPTALFFQKLGITGADGKPKIARSSKLRQCQKFVEIVSRLVDDSSLASSKDLNVVDMGCGRGYLTFSLHSHLYKKFGRVQSHGIDVRPKLMKEVDAIARDLGTEFDGLKFSCGSIEDATNKVNEDIDVLIALHACDTATDDSLWYGIEKNSKIIVTAPCCHQQVRAYLDSHVASVPDHPYQDILRHNIYKERIAETVTDSIRALLLEIADYNVQVFEFIGGEHTSKNVMIAAVKRTKARSEKQHADLRARLLQISSMHGIKRQKLADLMGEPVSDDIRNGDGKEQKRVRHGQRTSMPPL